MEGAPLHTIKWALTREALSKFLSCLDGNPDKAGEKYEATRLRLVKFFDWRGAHFPDHCRRGDDGSSAHRGLFPETWLNRPRTA